VKYTIWHDNDYDFAMWVYENSELKNKTDVEIRPIPKNNNPNTLLKIIKTKEDSKILPVIKYESADIIIQKTTENENKILLVTEFMTHTPQWHHPAQRFTRIYGASNLKIPCALVVARNMIKYEREDEVYIKKSYSMSPITPKSFYKTGQVNNTPTLIFFWPTNEFHKIDPKRPTAPRKIEDIMNWLEFLNACLNENKSDLEKIQEKHDKKIIEFLKTKSSERGITSMKDTKINIENYKELLEGPIQIKGNKEYLKIPDDKKLEEGFIFAPGGLSPSSSYFRTDPYAGMLAVYDSIFCRNMKGERKFNLILRAKNVKLSVLKEKGTFIDTQNHSKKDCPFNDFQTLEKMDFNSIQKHLEKGNCPFTSTKQQRIYAQIADMIIFDDVIYVGDKE